jgi:flagellar hook assembly protein FlgD
VFGLTVFAESAKEFLPSDVLTLKDVTFEKYSGDYVIKNSGVLTLENCTFKNNELGSKNSNAIFSNDKIVAPVINYGKLTLKNCKFIGNYSWNTAISPDLKAQATAGAIANFGELNLSNVTFENNTYQKGHFTIIRDESIEQISFVGNDTIYNYGNLVIKNTANNTNTANSQNSALQLEIALVENPVKEKAEIVVSTNVSARIEIAITNVVGDAVFTLSVDGLNGVKKYSWNLKNKAGIKVPSGTYSLRVTASNNSGMAVKTLAIGVKE